MFSDQLARAVEENPLSGWGFSHDTVMGKWVRIAAALVISGRSVESGRDFNSMVAMAHTLMAGYGLTGQAARLRAAQIVAAPGWRIFEDYLVQAGGLEAIPLATLRDELARSARRLDATPAPSPPRSSGLKNRRTPAGAWLTDPARRRAVVIALNLVPFAGIAFLWFIGVVRDRIGQREDRFFASVFLGSGLLFVAMLFAAAAFAGGLIANAAAGSAAPGPDTLAGGRQITSLLLHVYAMRMAAVFTMSTATITLRTQVVPRWIGLLGFAVAVVLLVSVGLTVWVELLFPAWILLLSVDILRTGLRQSPGTAEAAIGARA